MELRLSKREVQIVTLMAVGLGDEEIGKKLGIATRTVGTFNNRAYAKLGGLMAMGVNKRCALVAAAFRCGYITSEDFTAPEHRPEQLEMFPEMEEPAA